MRIHFFWLGLAKGKHSHFYWLLDTKVGYDFEWDLKLNIKCNCVISHITWTTEFHFLNSSETPVRFSLHLGCLRVTDILNSLYIC